MIDIDGYVTKDNLYRLISKIRRNPDIVVDDKTCCIITDAISKMEPLDVRPVKYGYWSECYTDSHHYSGICSVCGRGAIRKVETKPLGFCPNCGARMEGDKNEKKK